MYSLNDIEKGLVKKACEAMAILGIPSREDNKTYFPEHEEFKEFAGITQEEILAVDIYPMIHESPIEEKGDTIRVPIKTLGISRILGFDQDSSIASWIVGVAHDEGKLKLKKYYPENNRYILNTRRYFYYLEKLKRGHVSVENIPQHWGKLVAAAVESTHIHQKITDRDKPYPKKLILPRTKESNLLSQFVAISDSEDTFASQPDILTNKYLSSDEIMDGTLKEYGDLRIKYNGKLFPKIDISGRELIIELQKRGYIARERPANVREEDFRMNPFYDFKLE